MNNMPLISIVTPSYNSSVFIKETIESVLAQTYKNWEMIIVDDGSTDKSQEIIKQYVQHDIRIKLLVNQENIGVSKSRNRSIDESKGEYIAFLDSDDVWLPLKLEKQIGLMEKDNIFMSYSSYYTIDKDSQIIGTFFVEEKVTYGDLLKTSNIGTLTTIYNAKKLGKIYFEEIGHEDYVMKLHILKKIEHAKGIIEPLAKYRVHDNGLSNNKFKAVKWQWNIYRDIEKISFLRSLYYFLHYAYFGFFKYKR